MIGRLLSRRKLLCAIAAAITVMIANIPAAPGDPHAAEWRAGDIVCLNGISARSKLVRLLQGYSSDYSHVGIVVMQNGVPYVVNADPAYGKVVELRWDAVVAASETAGGAVYRVQDLVSPDAIAASVAAQHWAHAGIPFDNDFSLATADKLFCTELVWRAYRTVGVDLCENAEKSHPHLLPADLLKSPRLKQILRF